MATRRGVAATGGTMVLDSEGLSKLAGGHGDTRALVELAQRRGTRIVVAAVTLTEVLRGGPRDANIHRVLSSVAEVVPVDAEIAREAAARLLVAGLDGHRCAIDAMVAAIALRQARPVILLTSDPNDMGKLVDEPERHKNARVTVVTV